MTDLLLPRDAAEDVDGQAHGMTPTTWLRRPLIATSCALALGVAGCADGDPEILADPEPVELDAGADVADDGATQDVDVIDDFETLDVDGDSYLDPDEVAEWRDADRAFASWDADADSELDRDEIDGNVFQLYDEDGDGTVSETEWVSAAESLYPEEEELAVFSDVDEDGDAAVDADELAEGADLSPLGSAWTASTLDEHEFRDAYFELYDVDDDGRVSETEFRDGSSRFGAPER